MASQFINTMTSFSGADLVATFANKVIGELQQISWAIQRQKAPVFTLGSPDARSFSRGKRGIAGSLVFAVFDQDGLVEGLKSVWKDIAPKAMFTAAGNKSNSLSEDFTNALNMASWNQQATDTLGTNYGFAGTTAVAAQQGPRSDDPAAGNVYIPAGFSTLQKDSIVYADTIPPFDITLTFANEYGQCAFQKIYDADILNEGSGVSVDTMVMERQMTYIARRMSPMTKGIYTREAGGKVTGVTNA